MFLCFNAFMTKIKRVVAQEILDSRGNPTVEVKVTLENGIWGSASVPSGASTGTHEAMELRDNDQQRYGGQGVREAVHNVNYLINDVLKGIEIKRQTDIDHVMIELDGTENKSRLGANAILGVSLAVARAGARAYEMPLYKYLHTIFKFSNKFKMPVPMMNILNGGAHANWSADIQEFMIVPQFKKFVDALQAGSEIFHSLGGILKSRGLTVLVGDEGGYAPPLKKNEDAFELIEEAITRAGYKQEIKMAFDAAASEFFDKKNHEYDLVIEKKKLNTKDLLKLYQAWLNKYPIISIEDGLAEDDWASWQLQTEMLGGRSMLVGDDLFTTNVKRLEMGLSKKVANAVIVKPNQIGTLSETVDFIKMAQNNNYKVVISHRSGETCDSFIADLAVASGADFIKAGSLSREERLSKYNRLLEIERELA